MRLLLSLPWCWYTAALLHIWRGLPLDRLENSSRTVKSAKALGQEQEAMALILEPLKKISKGIWNSSRKEDILRLNQSLRILSNLVAADAITHVGREDIMFELLGLTSVLLSQKKTDNLDMIAKSFSITRKLIDCDGDNFGSSYFTQWVTLVELFIQVPRTRKRIVQSGLRDGGVFNHVFILLEEPRLRATVVDLF